MKYLTAIMLCMLLTSPILACEGYQNAMGALEDAIIKSAAKAPPSTNPQIRSINQSIDELEKAIAERRQEQVQAKTPKPATPPIL